jgi:hypothetical protein
MSNRTNTYEINLEQMCERGYDARNVFGTSHNVYVRVPKRWAKWAVSAQPSQYLYMIVLEVCGARAAHWHNLNQVLRYRNQFLTRPPSRFAVWGSPNKDPNRMCRGNPCRKCKGSTRECHTPVHTFTLDEIHTKWRELESRWQVFENCNESEIEYRTQ